LKVAFDFNAMKKPMRQEHYPNNLPSWMKNERKTCLEVLKGMNKGIIIIIHPKHSK